jgi:hypothetical protein
MRKPIVIRYRYDINTNKKSFLFNMTSSCKGNDHESISSISTISTQKEITNEETDMNRKRSYSYASHQGVVREPVMNRY